MHSVTFCFAVRPGQYFSFLVHTLRVIIPCIGYLKTLRLVFVDHSNMVIIQPANLVSDTTFSLPDKYLYENESWFYNARLVKVGLSSDVSDLSSRIAFNFEQ